MKLLLQRVTQASVSVEDVTVSRIGPGLLVFLGLEQGDSRSTAEQLLHRLLGYRIFADAAGRMNLSVTDAAGDILVVPQFTLAADTTRGRRPGFSRAMPPAEAQPLYDFCLDWLELKQSSASVAGGVFGADMQVSLVNDGPVTFLLTS
ncbi:MAG: D-aminoacyl-tRNA deacylase [Chromatocurvus sp.]